LEVEIERLIGLLDGIDGDEDLEATGDDEPSLGWPNAGQRPEIEMSDDREFDDCDYEDGPDSEPDLGWTEEIDQQRRLQTVPGWKAEDGEPELGFVGHGTGWACETIYDDDREDVSEDEGADIQSQPHDAAHEGDDEPTLGRLETIHQGAASYSGISDDDIRSNALGFDSDGYSIGKHLLRQIGADGSVRTAAALPIAEYREIAETLPDGTVTRSIVSKSKTVLDLPESETVSNLNGDWRALHCRAAHKGKAKTGKNR
jgi:hypothetical protein